MGRKLRNTGDGVLVTLLALFIIVVTTAVYLAGVALIVFVAVKVLQAMGVL